MDFQTLKRRELQALCKLNNIPANLTNAAMADSLQSLPTVNGIEDILELLQNGVADSPYVGTSIRRKPAKEGMEGSELATRTRCGTRGVTIEGTGTRKTTTTATRTTTRRRANEEASIRREIERNMQAKFEEDLELSDITVNSGIESEETSVVTASVDYILSRSQNEPEHKGEEVNNNGEVAYVGDDKENMGEDQAVNEGQKDYTEMSNIVQKFDFHSLGRKDLQNFCKRNKIPANMTNAAMADALVSLDNVEGLEEFLEAYDPLAIKSPETSQRTSSRVSQARTGRKTTGKKSARPGSALCKSVSRKMESLVLDSIDCVPENSTTTNEESKPLSEEVLNEADTSTDALVAFKEIQEETGENECDGRGNEGALTEICDTSKEVDANLVIESTTNVLSTVVSVQEISSLFETGAQLQDDVSENANNDQEVKVVISESNVNELVITEAPEEDINELDQCIETNDSNADTQTLESEFHTNSSEEPNCEGLLHDAPTVVINEIVQSVELSDVEADDKEPDDDDVEQQFVFETAAQAKATPLCHKSLRKLKKLVKEKIQETNLLAKKLEKLTLQENEILADNNNLEIDEAKLKKDDLTKATELSDQLDSTTVTVFEDDEESNEVLEMKANEGNKEAGTPITLPLELLKVPKPLFLTTPIKSSSKTPISAKRTLRVLDANKENIDDSTTKTTEVGNIKMIVTPAKSIGKLKKEVKVLLQSEKKRPALQLRSDNQCTLTSP